MLDIFKYAFPGLNVALEGMGCSPNIICPDSDPSAQVTTAVVGNLSREKVVSELIDLGEYKNQGHQPVNETQEAYQKAYSLNLVHIDPNTGHATEGPTSIKQTGIYPSR